MTNPYKREKCGRCGLKGVTTTEPYLAYWNEKFDRPRRVQRTKRCRYCGAITYHEATDLTPEERDAIIRRDT